MTNDDPSTTEADSARRDAVRAKAKSVKARIARRKYARRAAITIVIVAAVVAAGWWVWRSVEPELAREVVVPENLTDGAIDVISLMPEDERPELAEDPIAIDVYVDYMSPEAGTIETSLAPSMYELVADGVVTLAYHPVSLLSGESNGTQYSTRAAGAVLCVVTESPEAFRDVNSELLTNQPAEASDGFTDAELAEKAADAGAEGVSDCIENRTFAPWVSDATAQLLDGDLEGTDGVQLTSDAMVLVDGLPYEGALDNAAEFSQFLLTVQSEQYYGGTDPSTEPDAEDDSE